MIWRILSGELRKGIHSIMLDLLDEKWDKEAVDAMNDMEDFVRSVKGICSE